MVAASCCRSPIAFSMRALTLFSTSLIELKAGPAGAAVCSVFIIGLVDERTDGLAHRHTHYMLSVVSKLLRRLQVAEFTERHKRQKRHGRQSTVRVLYVGDDGLHRFVPRSLFDRKCLDNHVAFQ